MLLELIEFDIQYEKAFAIAVTFIVQLKRTLQVLLGCVTKIKTDLRGVQKVNCSDNYIILGSGHMHTVLALNCQFCKTVFPMLINLTLLLESRTDLKNKTEEKNSLKFNS